MAAQGVSCVCGFRLISQPLLSCSYRFRYLRPSLRRAMSGPIIEAPSLIHEAIDEETIPNYNPNCYFSTHPGQILNDTYQIVTKLGWGFGSTVWPAEDIRQDVSNGSHLPSSSSAPSASIGKEEGDSPRYVAVKIGTSEYGGITPTEHELNLSKHISTTNPRILTLATSEFRSITSRLMGPMGSTLV